MVYKWKQPAWAFRSNAQEAGEQFEKLSSEGRLTAKEVVKENRPEEAPLHKDFEWNDEKAAEMFRENQARQMIRCIQVVEVEPEDNKEPEEIKIIELAPSHYYNLDDGTEEYKPIDVILKNEDDKELLLEKAKRELNTFRSKYKALSELAGIIDAIDDYLGPVA